MTIRFQVGKTYQTRSICDHDCIFSVTILGRTNKTVTIERNGELVKRKVSIAESGDECIMPFGSYSMAPCIRAGREIA